MSLVDQARAAERDNSYTVGLFSRLADRIEALESTLEAIWLQLDPGKADIQNVPLARVNIGALVMKALPNKPEKASTI